MLHECQDCTTAFASGLEACPHCRSTNYEPQGGDMPKSTRARGATNAAAGETGTEAEPEAVEAPVEKPAKKTAKKTTKKTTKKA